MSHSRIIALVTAVLFLLGAVAHGQQRVELSLIVTDKSKKSVNAIDKSEVRVSEDKVEQTVLSVEPDTRPIDYGLLLDASNSLRTLFASSFEAAKLLVNNRRSEDEIFIESFISSDKIEKVRDFTADNSALLAALSSIKLDGGRSAVIDAVYIGAEHIARSKSNDRRKALVIITDGEDRSSVQTLEKLIKLLRETRVQVFAIGLVSELDQDSGMRTSPRDKAEKLLTTIAEESGGRAFFPRDKNELTAAANQIAGDLRSQFRITYQSSNAKKGFRKVEVKLNSSSGEKRNAIVPRGYYAGSDGP